MPGPQISLVYPSAGHQSAKVRVFSDFAADLRRRYSEVVHAGCRMPPAGIGPADSQKDADCSRRAQATPRCSSAITSARPVTDHECGTLSPRRLRIKSNTDVRIVQRVTGRSLGKLWGRGPRTAIIIREHGGEIMRRIILASLAASLLFPR